VSAIIDFAAHVEPAPTDPSANRLQKSKLPLGPGEYLARHVQQRFSQA